MSTEVRYQVFISSTYDDLREERQQVTQAIHEMGSFPSGMELFPASDLSQWELIKRVILECDYYIVIVGGLYGSLGLDSISYTEMEYDFAISNNIPVLGFVRKNIDTLQAKHVENNPDKRQKLDAFRNRVMSRQCRMFESATELGMQVMKSLISEIRIRPRMGWVQSDKARTEDDKKREDYLKNTISEMEKYINALERKIRDIAITGDEIPREKLCQGTDKFIFTVFFNDINKKCISQYIEITWDEIFEVIAPYMYGYIVRKTSGSYANGNRSTYNFEKALEDLIRAKIIDDVQMRKMQIKEGDIDACIIQFKELGYIEFEENAQEGGGVFRGLTLTSHGEIYYTRLKSKLR